MSAPFDHQLLDAFEFLDMEALFEKKKDHGVHFSSSTDEWSTPDATYAKLHKEFTFTLDPCARAHNAKCPKFYTKKDDGLAQSWKGETVFVNPPYSQIKAWMEKAHHEAKNGGATVVVLVPARTDTKWFKNYAMKADEIRLVTGRLKFGKAKQGAPFPSMIAVFRANSKKRKPSFSLYDRPTDS